MAAEQFKVGEHVDITIRNAAIGAMTNAHLYAETLDATGRSTGHVRITRVMANVTIERARPVGEVMIPVEVAAHVLFHFGQGGWPTSGFKSSLLMAIATADIVNRNRIALGFPEYVAAFNLAQLTDDGTATLQAIVARDGE